MSSVHRGPAAALMPSLHLRRNILSLSEQQMSVSGSSGTTGETFVLRQQVDGLQCEEHGGLENPGHLSVCSGSATFTLLLLILQV